MRVSGLSNCSNGSIRRFVFCDFLWLFECLNVVRLTARWLNRPSDLAQVEQYPVVLSAHLFPIFIPKLNNNYN